MKRFAALLVLFALASVACSQCWGQLFRRGRAVRVPVVRQVFPLPVQFPAAEPAPTPTPTHEVSISKDGNVSVRKLKDCPHMKGEPVSENFGIDLEKTKCFCEDKYMLTDSQGTREVSLEEAYDVAQKGLPDDASKCRVTVIGKDEDRKRFEAAFAASDLAAACVLSSVPPDHWWLKDNETKATVFQTGGSPTIYLQAPDGKVLWRQDTDQGAIEAIRKQTKAYDPKRDPGPSNVLPAGWPAIPTPVYAIGGALALLVLFGRKQAT